jgi:hypothetical protein
MIIICKYTNIIDVKVTPASELIFMNIDIEYYNHSIV